MEKKMVKCMVTIGITGIKRFKRNVEKALNGSESQKSQICRLVFFK